tara:strand:+ start:373 stop:789 length:417 start_codon:yes stop_codon:yes gene_type:complete
LFEEWETFSETFPPSGMMRSGALFPLPQWVLPTSEKGSSSWPTPTATERSGINPKTGKGAGLTKTVQLYEANRKMWPTPLAQEAKHGEVSQWELETDHAGTRYSLRVAVAERGDTGQLNPTWVEWLMGFDPGWTDLED